MKRGTGREGGEERKRVRKVEKCGEGKGIRVEEEEGRGWKEDKGLRKKKK